MLVLSRRKQESVVVGSANGAEHVLRVTVLDITGKSVKLGFEAAKDVPVHRAELSERTCARRPRDPPAAGLDSTSSLKGDGKVNVLSGAGQGRGPNATYDAI